MITITIEGDRGEGKTVTAVRIVRMLRSLGMDVRYKGVSEGREAKIEKLIRSRPDADELGTDHREFVVRDLT